MPCESPEVTDESLLRRVRTAAELLELIDADRVRVDQLPAAERQRLFRAVAQLYLPDPVARRQRLKAEERARSAASIEKADSVLHETGIRTLRRQPVFNTPNFYPPKDFAEQAAADDDTEQREELEPMHCYVCKRQYSEVHHFYDQMCPPCAAINFAKRTERADLSGRVALVTGARVKIGYQAGLKLLRCGAHLIVTTRFPRDSAARYSGEPDFQEWSHRLEIFGLDLRHTPGVEAFCRQFMETHSRLDFIINNACQTVRRPPGFYQHMMEGERTALRDAPEEVRRLLGSADPDSGEQNTLSTPMAGSAELSQLPLLAEELLDQKAFFPAGALDQRIEFHGVGNSGIVAMDAQHKFFRLGVNAAAVSDAHVQVMSATMLKPGDCLVVISTSGRSTDLIDSAEIARKRGATLIVITASGSPLAQLGQGSATQVLLAVDHPEDYDRYSPMVSRLLHLVVIDILTTAVALRQIGRAHV